MWIFYSLLSYGFAAIANISDKYIVDKHIKDSSIIALFSGSVAFLVGFSIFVIRGYPLLPISQIALVLCAGVLLELYLIPYFYSLEHADASSVIPLFQLVPIFVLVMSHFFLNETLESKQMIGFVVLFFSSIFFLFTYGSNVASMKKVFLSMVLSSLLFAGSVIFFKRIVGLNNLWDSIAYEGIGMGIGTLIISLYPGYIKRSITYGKELKLTGWFALSCSEFFVVCYRMFFSTALSLGSATLINVLSGFQPVFVFIFGLILSKFFPTIIEEQVDSKTLRIKIISLAGIFVGLLFIYQL